MSPEEEQLSLCAKEVAQRLGVGIRFVYRLWDRKELGSFRLGNGFRSRRRCTERQLADYVLRQQIAEEVREIVAERRRQLAS